MAGVLKGGLARVGDGGHPVSAYKRLVEPTIFHERGNRETGESEGRERNDRRNK